MSASAFSDWVFKEEYGSREKGERTGLAELQKSLGALDHRTIQLAYQTAAFFKKFGRDFNIEGKGDWELIFSGDDDRFKGKTLFASDISFNGMAMACRPDVVLRERNSGNIVVIERKTTWVPTEKLSMGSWRNAQVQLWCYSHIDNWKSAPRVDLVLEVWQRQGSGLKFSGNLKIWVRSDNDHELFCRNCFDRYTEFLRRNG